MAQASPRKRKSLSVQLQEAEERLLEVERELMSVRLDLEEKERTANLLAKDLERQSTSLDESAETIVSHHLEKLFDQLSGPVSQLLTQAHLHNVEGRSVQSKDVLSVTSNLVRILTDSGLEVNGTIGEKVQFDAGLHEPLTLDAPIHEGETVTIRMVGVSYKGKLLRRASVSLQVAVNV